MSHNWPGRDDWFMALYLDPTLVGLRSGVMMLDPLRYAVKENPDRLVPRVMELLGHEKDTVHALAVRSLMGLDRSDSMHALLPWVRDSNWIRIKGPFADLNRSRLIERLGKTRVPGAAPELIHVLETGESRDRAKAAIALASLYKSPEVVPALRKALVSPLRHEERMTIVRALASLDSLTVEEVVKGLDFYAFMQRSEEDQTKLASAQVVISGGEAIASMAIGILAVEEYPQLSDRLAAELATAMFSAATKHDQSMPIMAAYQRRVMAAWPDPTVMRWIVTEWSRGKVHGVVVHRVLELRKQYADKVRGELSALIPKGGELAGLAAVVLGDEAAVDSIVTGRDDRAQSAALAAARLVRHPIDVAKVAPHIRSENKQLALAAERYLESEDSAEAREVLYKHHEGEFLILGARENFDPNRDPADVFEVNERKLVERIQSDETLIEIHALMSYIDDEGGKQRLTVIEVRENGAELIRSGTERNLTEAEWRDWSTLLAEQRILDLPPLIVQLKFKDHEYRGYQYEFLHLTRKRGRRLFMVHPGFRDWASPYHLLTLRLHRLR